MKNPRTILEQFSNGMTKFSESYPDSTGAFMNLFETNYKDGAVSAKTKELVSVAIGLYNRCDYCIVYHCYKALSLGATREEINEISQVAVVMGGGPTMAYSVTLLQQALDEFEKDFIK